MSRSFIQSGDVLTFTAPTGGVVAGTGVMIGNQLVIPRTTAAQTLPFDGDVTGVHSHAKTASQAWAEGQAVYWDNTNKVFTTVATGNTRAGIAVEAVGSGAGETTGKVRLNGAALASTSATEADLVEAFGTADGTLADVGAAFNQATLNNNFQDVATKINAILAKLRTAGIIG